MSTAEPISTLIGWVSPALLPALSGAAVIGLLRAP